MLKSRLKYYLVSLLLFTRVLNAEPVQLLIVTEHLPPFQISTEDGVSGFATEIVEALLTEANFDYHIIIYPWARAFNIALKNENTCIYSIARTPERETMFQWTKVIASTNSSFIGLKSNTNIHIESIEDAKKYVTAVIRDDFTHQLLLNNGFIEKEHFFLVNNVFSLLKLLVTRDDIDLILVDYLTIKYRSKQSQLDPTLFTPYLHLNEEPINFYLACSNNTPEQVVTQLSQAIDIIKEKGIYQKIINKWLDIDDMINKKSKQILDNRNQLVSK